MAQDNRQDNLSGQSSQSQSKPSQSSSSFSGQQSSGQQSSQSGNYSFRCADVGQKDCTWETRGSSEEEVLRNVEKHGREKHNITNFMGETRDRVRNAIRRVAA